MSDQEKRVIRIRVLAPQDVTYHGAIIMTPEGKQVKEHHSLAGETGEIRSYHPTEPVKQFISWKESLLFNEKADKSRTQDFDRLLARITRNIDFIDKFRQLLKGKQTEKITYDVKMEIQGSLGIKDPDVQIVTQPLTWGDDSAIAAEAGGDATDADAGVSKTANRIALTFIISPSTGTPLGQLEVGTEIIARFADPEDEQTSNYMIEQGLKFAALPEESDEGGDGAMLGEGFLPEDSAPAPKNEIQGTVESVEPHGDHTLILVKLPGGQDGYILEEEKSVKVKTVQDAAGKNKTGESAVGAANAEQTGAPRTDGDGTFQILMIAGGVALLLVLLAFLFL